MEDKKQNIQKQEEFEAFKQLLEKQIELEKNKATKSSCLEDNNSYFYWNFCSCIFKFLLLHDV